MTKNTDENEINATRVWEAARALAHLAYQLEVEGAESLSKIDRKFLAEVVSSFDGVRSKLKGVFIEIFKDFCATELAKTYSDFEEGKLNSEKRREHIDELIGLCEKQLEIEIRPDNRDELHKPVIEGKTLHSRGPKAVAYERVSYLFGDTYAASTIYRRRDRLFGDVDEKTSEVNREELAEKVISKILYVREDVSKCMASALSSEGQLDYRPPDIPLPSAIRHI